MGVRGRCSCCCHPSADAIDAELVDRRWTLRDLSKKWNIPKSSLHYHRQKHVQARLKRAAEERKAGSDPALLDKLAELNRLARGVLAKAYNAGELSVAVSAIGEARKQLELEARLLGQLREGGGSTTVNVTVTPEQGARIAQVYLQRRGLTPGRAIETTAAAQVSATSPASPGATEPQEEDVTEGAPAEDRPPSGLSATMERWHRLHPEAK